MKSSPRAFTLIELIISISIIAILSIGVAINFKSSLLKAKFNDEVLQIVHVLEQARSYSLTNFLINDTEPADYYLITITEAGVRLDVYGPTLDSGLENAALDEDFSITGITGSEYAFYFPPSGEICFDTPDCASGINEISFTVVDSTGEYSQEISLNKYGGGPQLESL